MPPTTRRLSSEESARVADNLGLVGMVLNRTRHAAHLPREDREQIARMGLIKAAMGYVAGRAKFSTYAHLLVTQALQAAHTEDRLIRVPKWVSNRDAGEGLKEAASRARKTVSLDALEHDPGDTDDVGEAIDSAAQIEALRAAIARLPERERKVVNWHMQEVTLKEMGKRIGVTKERARQIRERAIERLREMLS